MGPSPLATPTSARTVLLLTTPAGAPIATMAAGTEVRTGGTVPQVGGPQVSILGGRVQQKAVRWNQAVRLARTAVTRALPVIRGWTATRGWTVIRRWLVIRGWWVMRHWTVVRAWTVARVRTATRARTVTRGRTARQARAVPRSAVTRAPAMTPGQRVAATLAKTQA